MVLFACALFVTATEANAFTTVIVTCCSSYKGGVSLSVARTVNVKFPVVAGVHLNAPVVLFIVAPAGAPVNE